MAEKVRQHTVPKVYLKNFGTARKKNTYVYVYDKSSQNIFQSEISNVSVERNFYRLEAASDPLAVEDFYSRFVEPQTGEVIAEIIKKANLRVLSPNADVISLKTRARLSFYMLYQAQRGRVAKDYMVSMTGSVLPVVEQKALEYAKTHQIQNAGVLISSLLSDENVLKAARIQASIDPNRIRNLAYYFYDRCWILYQIIGDAEFITSDNPVMFANNATKDASPFEHGLSSNTTVVYYPLSDKLMLALYSYEYADGILNRFDSRIVRLEAAKEKRFIQLVNSLQLNQCKKQAFVRDIRLINEQGVVKTLQNIEAATLSETFWNVAVVQNLIMTSTNNPTYLVFLAAQVMMNDVSLLSNNVLVRELIDGGDVHHIFPKEYLKQKDFEKSQYNQEGNYAYLDTQVNKSIGKKAPNVYFSEAREQCETGVITIGSITDYDQLLANLETNCVPADVFDMDYTRYAEFLEKRRIMMAKKIRAYYEAL